MSASACLTLALLHLLIWSSNRTEWASLFFSLAAIGTAGVAVSEFLMMRASSPAEFATALRWLHPPTWLLILALTGFIHVYLRAGRVWLAWTVCGLRTGSLVINFLVKENINYREVTRLRNVSFLGESVSIAEAIPNPWLLLVQLTLFLFLIYVTDAAITVWRRGDRRKALVTGGSIVLFVLAGTAQSVLIFWQFVHWPLTPSLFFMGFIAAIGFNFSREVVRANTLASDLRESENRFRLAVEASPNGIVLVNGDGKIVLINSEVERLFGYTRDELVGRPIEVLVPDRFRDAHPDHRSRFFGAPQARAMGVGRDLYALRKDGTEFPVEIGLSPIQSTEGTLVLAAVVDISKRKRAELDAARQRTEMAHLSRVTMLGELSGSIAHELNQPLTAILSNAQAAKRFLARDDADLDEVRAILTDIVDQDNRAGEIIRRLRQFLKKGELQMQPLQLNDVVEEVLALTRSDLMNHGIVAQTELAAVLPAVNADRVQIQQVLLNLVLNACDAMNGNLPIDRQFVIRTELAGGTDVRVSISDCGSGIAADNVDHVFEPFFTTKSHGLGLGLSMCNTIITAHGGTIRAFNNAERGATFEFSLPVKATVNA